MNLNRNDNSEIDIISQIEQSLFTPQLQEIMGMAYVYVCDKDTSKITSFDDLNQSKFINKTIFVDFAWWKITDNPYSLYELAKTKLQEKLNETNHYILLLESVNNPSQLILVNSLKYLQNILEITLLGLPFELEKMKAKSKQSMQQANLNIDKIQKLEQGLYGWNVLDKQTEISMSYNYLSWLFINSHSLLTDQQQKLFLDWLQLIKSKIYFTNWKNNHILNYRNELDEKWQKYIGIEQAKEVFQLIINIYGLDKKVFIDDTGNFRVSDKWIHIPQSLDKIQLIALLRLIVHEIETHMICNYNNNITVWTFKGANHTSKEESLAVISEEVLIGTDLSILKYSGMIPVILMWELLQGEEFWQFMNIYTTLRREKLNPLSFVRFKRNYSFSLPWVQHKDTSYFRWITEIFEYLKSWESVNNLYIWNISLEDTKEIADKINGKNKQLKFPLMIGEIILYSMKHHSIHHENFMKYLEEKYSFTKLQWGLSRLTLSQKKKLMQVLNLISNSFYS